MEAAAAECRPPLPGDRAALEALWLEAFGDSPDFIRTFFRTGFSPDRCLIRTEGGTLAAALHWFVFRLGGQRLPYLYGVATARAARGRGHCTRLMEEARRRFARAGMAGILLVPGSAALFDFYGRMGYRPVCPARRFTAEAGPSPAALVPVSGAEYIRRRAALLPPGSAEPEAEALPFLEAAWQLFSGPGLILACLREPGGGLSAMELLCEGAPESAAPGILAALGADRGVFRTPDPTAPCQAMLLPLPALRGAPPAYLGLDFG